MKLLLAAATEAEIGSTLEALASAPDTSVEVTPCITGVGLTAATFALTRALCTDRYDFVIQAGIGGAFDRSIALGTVALVERETFGDLGAEDNDGFLTVFDLGFEDQDRHPFQNGSLINPLSSIPFDVSDLPRISSLTVHTVSGIAHTVSERASHYGASLESMEGAALHFVCLSLGIPFLQLRAVSNYVEPRNRAAWQVKPAIAALNAQLQQWLLPR
jgi:futalosine hydrolase